MRKDLRLGLLLAVLFAVSCSGKSGSGQDPGFSKDFLEPADLVADKSSKDVDRDIAIKDLQVDLADTPKTDALHDALGDGSARDQLADGAGDVKRDVLPDLVLPDVQAGKDTLVDAAVDTALDTGCVPQCDKLSCGEDSCGGVCPCPAGYACPLEEPWVCSANCAILCTGRKCGRAGLNEECNCGTCDDLDQCTKDECLPEGVCSNTEVEQACDDGNPCTRDDVCTAGACKGVPLPIADLLTIGCLCQVDADCQWLDDEDVCNGELACDKTKNPPICTTRAGSVPVCGDTNPCTKDTCDPAAGCIYTADDTASCVDADRCNGDEKCVGGTCVAGQPLQCTSTECATAKCVADQGCVFTPVADGSLCAPVGGRNRCIGGNCECLVNCEGKVCGDNACGGVCGTCPAGQPCIAGKCICTPSCSGKMCGDDGCGGSCGSCTGPYAGYTCVLGKCACVDNCKGKECGDSCGVACGDCQPGWTCLDFKCVEKVDCYTAAECNDNDPCTTDTCVGYKCQHACTEGVSCNDNNTGTLNDRCIIDAGKCVCKGQAECSTSEDCDDANPCTWDECDVAGACHHYCGSQSCNDGNAYTLADHCTLVAGGKCTCTGTLVECLSALDCDDKNQCTVDTCSTAGKCEHACQPMHGCDDGLPTTTNDTCSVNGSGACVCTGLTFQCQAHADCDDKNPCTTDTCNDYKCVYTCLAVNTVCGTKDKCKTSGTGCACTPVECINDAQCNDNNPCTSESCSVAGVCNRTCNVNTNCGTKNKCKLSGTNCACTAVDCINDGQCNDNNGCTSESCSAAGACNRTCNVNSLGSCPDRQVCRSTGGGCVCQGVECTNGNHCADNNPCTDRWCNGSPNWNCGTSCNNAGCGGNRRCSGTGSNCTCN